MWNDATEQARPVRDGEVSAVELVDAPISRLQVPPELNVLVTLISGPRVPPRSGAWKAARIASLQ